MEKSHNKFTVRHKNYYNSFDTLEDAEKFKSIVNKKQSNRYVRNYTKEELKELENEIKSQSSFDFKENFVEKNIFFVPSINFFKVKIKGPEQLFKNLEDARNYRDNFEKENKVKMHNISITKGGKYRVYYHKSRNNSVVISKNFKTLEQAIFFRDSVETFIKKGIPINKEICDIIKIIDESGENK